MKASLRTLRKKDLGVRTHLFLSWLLFYLSITSPRGGCIQSFQSGLHLFIGFLKSVDSGLCNIFPSLLHIVVFLLPSLFHLPSLFSCPSYLAQAYKSASILPPSLSTTFHSVSLPPPIHVFPPPPPAWLPTLTDQMLPVKVKVA